MSVRGRTRRRPICDPSSPDPRPVIARSQPSLPDPVPIIRCCVPVVARFFLNFHTRCRALRIHRRELWARHRELWACRCALPPIVARCGPVVGHYGPVVARCIPVVARCATRRRDPSCTFHSNCLRDSPQGANYFSSHVIHHH